MRVTIKGLTDSTITFNTLGIILRGNSSKPELYPNSIAKHIDIKNDAQMRELIGLKNAKLVSVIDESEDYNTQVPVSTNNIVKIPIKTIEKSPQPPKPPKPPVIEESNVIKTEEIEDMPLPPPEEDEEEFLTISSKNPIKKVGRPKKTTKTTKTTKTVKPAKEVKTPPKVAKPIKRSKNFIVVNENKDQEVDSKIVVMTPNGPIEGKAINNMAGEMPESEATRASIEALKQLEDEDSIPESLIDESKLDISQRMGESAVVATGENSVTKIAMRNSILPDADAIKNRGVKFIDPNGDDTSDKTSLDESIKDIFIDKDDKGDKDGSDDGFIEY